MAAFLARFTIWVHLIRNPSNQCAITRHRSVPSQVGAILRYRVFRFVSETRVFATTTGETERGADEHLMALQKSSHKHRLTSRFAHRVLSQCFADRDAAAYCLTQIDITIGTEIEDPRA